MKQAMTVKIEQRPRIKGVCALARKLGVSRCHIYHIIRGTRRPSPTLARKFARYGIELNSNTTEVL